MNSELLNKTITKIPDNNIRKLIFGTNDIRKEDIENYLSNMNNLIMLSFFVYYKVWEKENPTSPVLDSLLSSVYTTHDLTLDIISYIIGQLQIETSKNKSSYFNKLISGDIENSKVPLICELIMQWKKSYNNQMMDVSKLREYYNSLLDTFSYLSNCYLDDDYTITVDNNKYDLSVFIKITDDDDYYLYNIEEGNLDVILNYVSYTRRKYFQSVIHKKDIDKCREVN